MDGAGRCHDPDGVTGLQSWRLDARAVLRCHLRVHLNLDFARIKRIVCQPVIVDTKNLLD